MESRRGEVSELLARYGRGDREALERLIPLVYGELRRLAAYHLRAERAEHTLQPTALVHEAYLRLFARPDAPPGLDRTHFIALASHVMRHVLVDHARTRAREKRGGRYTILGLDEADAAAAERDVELVALDEALERLAVFDPAMARVVELRYFGGLTIEEIAGALGIAPAMVRRTWAVARAWLRREMEGRGDA